MAFCYGYFGTNLGWLFAFKALAFLDLFYGDANDSQSLSICESAKSSSLSLLI